MFVTEYTTRVELPNDNGAWVEIRPLAWLELQRAADKSYIDTMHAISEIDVEKVIGEASEEDIKALAERYQNDPMAGLDQLEVLKAGILSWSAEVPVDEDHIKLLEPEVAKLIADRIAGLRRKDDLGNSSSPSTTTSQA